MAEFNVVGFDEIEKEILRRSEAAQRIAPDMLKAGASILITAQKAELRRISRGDRSIGTLADSIGMGKIRNSKDALKMYVDVYPQDDQPHGTPGFGLGKNKYVSNAQVGFTLEYGSSDMPSRPWMSVALQKSETAIHDAMITVWEEKQNE